MISLAVLRQYVKVFFGEHGLELRDVGGQWSSSGLCLFAMSGSFRKMLGGHSHSSEVGRNELRKEARKKESVSRLPVGAIHLRRGLFKL